MVFRENKNRINGCFLLSNSSEVDLRKTMRNDQDGFTLLELLLALSLGALLFIGVTHIFITLSALAQRQWSLSNTQQQVYFLDTFLRKQIQMSGDDSCLRKTLGLKAIVVRGFDRDDAADKLGLTIKSGTDLLQLHECVRIHGHFHYLPIDFFIANTFRVNKKNKEIDALFYKIAHHAREELITGMTDFQLFLGVFDHSGQDIRAYYKPSKVISRKKVGAVRIEYVLGSLHQFGVLYVAIRKK